MNNYVRNESTNRPVSLKNETTPDTAIFSVFTPTPTSSTAVVAASTIVPDAHIPPSGQKQHTKPFSPIEHVEDGQ